MHRAVEPPGELRGYDNAQPMQAQTMIGLADDYDEDAIIDLNDLMAGSLLFSSLDEEEKESLPAELRTRVEAAGC